MIVLALDPGGTTGYSYIATTTNVWKAGELEPEQVWDFLNKVSPDKVVVEKFVHRPNLRATDLEAVEVIGVIKQWARKRNRDIVWQMPSQAKKFFDNDKLKERDRYTKGSTHARDATRHLLYYLEFSGGKRRG